MKWKVRLPSGSLGSHTVSIFTLAAAVNEHPGNIDFRNRVRRYIPRYMQADKTGKTQICQKIIDTCMNEGIRFLQKDGTNDQWYHILEHTARAKAAQTIQDIIKKWDKEGADRSSEMDQKARPFGGESEGEVSVGSQSVRTDEGEEGQSDDDDYEEEEEEVQEEDEHEDQGESEDRAGEDNNALKLPAFSSGSASFGSDARELHASVFHVAFPSRDESAREQQEATPPIPRPEAQLRPAAVPNYLRHLSFEDTNDGMGYGSLHDSDEG